MGNTVLIYRDIEPNVGINVGRMSEESTLGNDNVLNNVLNNRFLKSGLKTTIKMLRIVLTSNPI